MSLDFNKIEELISQKYISRQKHPIADLYILNYTQTTQYEQVWNTETMACRGLIIDGDNNLIARPFKKFKNLSEHQPGEIPSESFEVFDKLDGSLGILYWLDEMPYIATRGSFVSDQAIHATEILYKKYFHLFDKIDKSQTYLFEIIYPENQIVVNNQGIDDIILIAQIDTATGGDMFLKDIGFPIVEKFDGINDLEELKIIQKDNKEGFVIKFKNGFRVKMKFEEYVRLHRIVTGVSNISIWEYLKTEKPFDDILEKVPDEWYQWVKKTRLDLENQFKDIEWDCKEELSEIYIDLEIQKPELTIDGKRSYFPEAIEYRKEFGKAVFSRNKYKMYSEILFLMRDDMDYKEAIWNRIRPKFCKPFKEITGTD